MTCSGRVLTGHTGAAFCPRCPLTGGRCHGDGAPPLPEAWLLPARIRHQELQRRAPHPLGHRADSGAVQGAGPRPLLEGRCPAVWGCDVRGSDRRTFWFQTLWGAAWSSGSWGAGHTCSCSSGGGAGGGAGFLQTPTSGLWRLFCPARPSLTPDVQGRTICLPRPHRSHPLWTPLLVHPSRQGPVPSASLSRSPRAVQGPRSDSCRPLTSTLPAGETTACVPSVGGTPVGARRPGAPGGAVP